MLENEFILIDYHLTHMFNSLAPTLNVGLQILSYVCNCKLF